MLNHSDDSDTGERPEISRLIERLARESRQWAEAEVTLARIEIAELKARAIRLALFGALAFAALLCMLLALTQAGVALLAPLVGSVGAAALAMALVFAAVTVAALLGARRAASWRTESVFFRWLGSRSARSDAP